jgi:molybdopterin converting factor small subunit
LAEIWIRYFGPLREAVGRRSEKITVDDSASLRELLEKLTNIHGPKFRNFVFAPTGKIRQGIAFAIDGNTISSSQLPKIKSRNIEEFVILPPISGGGPQSN